MGIFTSKAMNVGPTTLCPQHVQRQIGEQLSVLQSSCSCATLVEVPFVNSLFSKSSLHGNAESNTTKIR